MNISHNLLTRRRFIVATGLATSSIYAATRKNSASADEPTKHPIATNTYPWETFAKRQGKTLELHTDQLLSDIASTGIKGYEPNIRTLSDLDGLQDRLKKHGLVMPSIYVNSVLHDENKSAQSIGEVLAIASRAVEIGTKILVTNPSPIRWGGTEDKSDSQLKHQAASLDKLGEQLRKLGIALAYHNHDSELRQGAREFHHMLTATSPQNVKFCLDAHWIYRGCGNSQVALFDAVVHYRDRIVELHLRQSERGVWTQAFSMDGDIDYRKLISDLSSAGIHPHVVLEQAIEPESKVTVSVVEAHRLGLQNLRGGDF
jgi:inosose dehydratase